MDKTPTLLVADDTASNIEILHGLLEGSYEILFATQGAEAVALATQNLPDLVLMDIMMPKMDGFEACGLLKKNPRTHHIPVLFLTALSDPEAVVRGFDAGGVDFITKPFQERELRARIHTHLTLKFALDRERELRAQLEEALASVKQLSGLLPICSHCKKIRDDRGYWNQLEYYISTRSEARFTHGFCPACMAQFYGIK